MRFINNEKGVTVMSLVITIIIMIILTAVSLNGAFGGEGSKNSLVEKAKNAIYKSEVEDLKDFWDAKIVGIDTTYLNYDSLEDVMDVEQIPESLRGVFAVKQGRLVYKDDQIDDSKKEILKEFEIYSTFVNPIEVTIKATIKKVTEAKSADVIAVIDASSSMYSSSVTSSQRYENVCVALNTLMETVLESDENNRFGLVQFDAGYNTLLGLDHYTKNASDEYITSFYGKINNEENKRGGLFATSLTSRIPGNIKMNYMLKSGTNVQTGAAKAEQMFQFRRSADNAYQDSEKLLKNKTDYLILLTDGDSYYYNTTLGFEDLATKYSADSNSSTTGYTSAYGADNTYYTVNFLTELKEKHSGDLKIYTINYGTSTYSKITMNPTKANVNNMGDSTAKTNLLSLIDPEGTDDTTKHNVYVDKAYSGDYDEDELKNIFAEIGQEIISQDNTVVEMDKTERYTSVIIENKMQYYDDNGNLIEYQLDETEGDVVVNVNAAVFVPTAHTDASGNIIRAADTNRTKTYTKTYTIADIKAGRDPNLVYENGNIVWNIESDFDSNSTSNIKAEALNNLLSSGVTYDTSANETIDIQSVEIILPLVTYAESE